MRNNLFGNPQAILGINKTLLSDEIKMVTRQNESFVLLDLLSDYSLLFLEDFSVGYLLKERDAYMRHRAFG